MGNIGIPLLAISVIACQPVRVLGSPTEGEKSKGDSHTRLLKLLDKKTEKITFKLNAIKKKHYLYYPFYTDDHPGVELYEITNEEECTHIIRNVDNPPAPCLGWGEHTVITAVPIGTIIFYSGDNKIEATITNRGFFYGKELVRRKQFHSWILAMHVSELASQNGPPITQRVFNSLSGLGHIFAHQISSISKSEGYGRQETDLAYDAFMNRPADPWAMLPSKQQLIMYLQDCASRKVDPVEDE